ncbi:unnamed protein product, partial [Amoebophrya sp. A25]
TTTSTSTSELEAFPVADETTLIWSPAVLESKIVIVDKNKEEETGDGSSHADTTSSSASEQVSTSQEQQCPSVTTSSAKLDELTRQLSNAAACPYPEYYNEMNGGGVSGADADGSLSTTSSNAVAMKALNEPNKMHDQEAADALISNVVRTALDLCKTHRTGHTASTPSAWSDYILGDCYSTWSEILTSPASRFPAFPQLARAVAEYVLFGKIKPTSTMPTPAVENNDANREFAWRDLLMAPPDESSFVVRVGAPRSEKVIMYWTTFIVASAMEAIPEFARVVESNPDFADLIHNRRSARSRQQAGIGSNRNESGGSRTHSNGDLASREGSKFRGSLFGRMASASGQENNRKGGYSYSPPWASTSSVSKSSATSNDQVVDVDSETCRDEFEFLYPPELRRGRVSSTTTADCTSRMGSFVQTSEFGSAKSSTSTSGLVARSKVDSEGDLLGGDEPTARTPVAGGNGDPSTSGVDLFAGLSKRSTGAWRPTGKWRERAA